MSRARILTGDCLDLMPTLDAESVDAIVTDPPAGISFMGKAWDHHKGGREQWISWLADVMRECLRVAKPGAHALVWALPRTSHWTGTACELAGWEVRDRITHLFGSGFPKSLDVSKAIDKATDAARQWEGWGTALKPAAEDWWLLRKPLSGTVAANVQAHGTGALNIDGCRIAGKKPDTTRGAGGQHGITSPRGAQGRILDDGAGRWPANVVLDEDAARLLDEQSGERTSGQPRIDRGRGGIWSPSDGTPCGPQYGDYGGASRFFYTAKASRAERERMEGGPTEPVRRTDGRAVDIENPRLRTSPRVNHHPTVKPLDLMRWLVRLVTPPGGLVLDPFAGSGTTGVAAMAEGFRFLGIEREPEYVAIAEARLNATQPGLLGGAA